MAYRYTLRQVTYQFDDLQRLFAAANELKSGDQLAGLAATCDTERMAAKLALANVHLSDIAANPLIEPDCDDVSRLIITTHDQQRFKQIQHMTVGEFRELLLTATGEELTQLKWAFTPDLIAAVTKLMSNKELVIVARRIRVMSRCRNTIGGEGTFAVRLQPNHPTDDLSGILLSALDGLAMGCGDAVIGVNPATESIQRVGDILRSLDQLITSLEIPTQACCLSHISTQVAAMNLGAPVDLLFQSIGGTQQTNTSFGISLQQLQDGRDQTLESHRQRSVHWVGSQCLYFETGQGSALSADAHHGVDQLTLEARAYGLARCFDPFLVNSVVGFIGPEYLFDERQIIRAGLEDHFMGKLLGLPMGVDVCYTNHAEADQNSADNLLMMLALAGCNYVMGVPCADDVMLNYQSTSFHDANQIRELLNLSPAPEFLTWLHDRGIYQAGRLAPMPLRIPDFVTKHLEQFPN